MTPELQQYYESMFDLFNHKGWKYLTEDFKAIRDQAADISTVLNDQQLNFRKGQLDILDLLLKRKEACDAAFEELSNG